MTRQKSAILVVGVIVCLALRLTPMTNGQSLLLGARQSKSATATPGSSPAVIEFLVDDGPAGTGAFDIVFFDSRLAISVLTPAGLEANLSNAASLGFSFERSTVSPEAGLASMLVPGEHVAIRLPLNSSPGIYKIKVDASSATQPAPVIASYLSSSPVRMGGIAAKSVYTPSDPIAITAFVLDGQSPVLNATVSAAAATMVSLDATASIAGYQPVSSQTLADGTVRSTYRAVIANNGPARDLVRAEIRPALSGITVIDGSLSFDTVPAGGSRPSIDTFVVERDATTAFDPSSLAWRIETPGNPVNLTLRDDGNNDPVPNDGNYTGFLPAQPPGEYTVYLTATGASSSGIAFAREAYATFTVRQPGARIVSFQSRGIDDNGNGKFDRLLLDVNLDVTVAGEYEVFLKLQNPTAATAVIATRLTRTLGAGPQQITVPFGASNIVQFLAADGPWAIKDVLLTRKDTSGDEEVVEESRSDAGLTGPHPLSSFDRGTLYFTGQMTAIGVDANGVPGFETLRVSAEAFTPALPCTWIFTLSDIDGNVIEEASNSAPTGLQAGLNTVTIDFSGPRISRARKNGPFRVGGQIRCRPRVADKDPLGQTQAFAFSQFENAPADFRIERLHPSVSASLEAPAETGVQFTPLNGFDNPVTISASGLPAGATAAIGANRLTNPGPSFVTLTVSTNTPAGTYPISITGTGGGLSRTAVINLVVTNGPVSVSLSPSQTSYLYANQTRQFTATVTNTDDTSVLWTLEPAIGSISSSGLYTAPSSIATPVAVTVRAAARIDPERSATSEIQLFPPAVVTLTPATDTIYGNQQRVVQASAVNAPPNAAVTFNMSPAIGTLTQSDCCTALYTAPPSVTATQNVVITATLALDPTRTGSATIKLPPPIAVSLTPGTATVNQAQTQPFAASIVNAPDNPALNFILNPNLGSVAPNGVYTAPPSVSQNQNVSLTAVSAADPTKSATAQISLRAPASVIVTPAAVTAAIGSPIAFTAAVQNAASQAVTWSVSPATGAIDADGVYTPPATLPAPQTIFVTATSVSDPTRRGTATIYLTPSAIPSAWTSEDIGGVQNGTGFSEAAGAYSIAAAGCCLFFGSDVFRFAWQPMNGDGTLVARVSQWRNPRGSSKAGIMIRESSAPGAPHVFAGLSAAGNGASILQSRTTAGSTPALVTGLDGSAPQWYKLVRSGNTFSGFVSEDGASWVALGSPVTVNMPAAVLAGLAVSSEETGQITTGLFDSVSLGANPDFYVSASPSVVDLPPGGNAAFSVAANLLYGFSGPVALAAEGLPDGVSAAIAAGTLRLTAAPSVAPGNYEFTLAGTSAGNRRSTRLRVNVGSAPLPAPWQADFLGGARLSGLGASQAAGVFGLSSVGCCVDGQTDRVLFAHQSFTGDVVATARIANAGADGFAGLQIRQSLLAGALGAFAGVQTIGPRKLTMRVRTDSPGAAVDFGSAASSSPAWIKLAKQGTAVSAYGSPDGNNWAPIGAATAWPAAEPAFAGLASSNTAATLDNVSLSQAPDLLISVPGSSQSAVPGGRAEFAIDAVALNSLPGPIAFSAAGLPSGATASFSPASLPGTGATVLTVNFPPSATPGAVNLTLTASAGSVVRTIPLTVTVQSEFSFSLSPLSRTVAHGETTALTATVQVAPNVTAFTPLQIAGLPFGATAQPDPASILNSGSSNIPVDLGRNGPGAYPLTVRANPGAPNEQSLTATIKVTPGFSISPQSRFVTIRPGNSANVTVVVVSSIPGQVALSVTGVPVGVAASISPSLVTGSGNPVLSFVVGAAVPAGDYPVTITGVNGTVVRNSTIRLLVSGETLSVSPATAAVGSGSSVDYAINVAVVGGGSGQSGTLSVTGLPAGALAQFNPPSLATGSAGLSIATAAATPAGTYPLVVRRTTPSATQTANVTLVVQPGFTLSNTAVGTVLPGETAGSRLTLQAQPGFAAPVNLSISGVPPGVTASFSSSTLNGDGASSNLTLVTAATLPGGSYPLTVTASGGGIAVTRQLTLRVRGISLRLSPASANVLAGSAANYSARVTFFNGFTDPVSLTATGLPTGVTAAFSPASLTATATSALALSAAASTAPGSYEFSVTAAGGGVTQVARATVRVQADLSLTVNPPSVSVPVGGRATYGATVAVAGGFSSPVTLSVTGLPLGVTGRFLPASVTGGGNSTLNLDLGSNAVPGTYEFTARASGGSRVVTQPVTLVVTPGVAVSVNPDPSETNAGAAATFAVIVTPSPGVSTPTALSVSGLPPGATAAFNPPAVSGAASSTLTVSTSATTPSGLFPLTVTATNGTLVRSDSTRLRVMNMTLAATPATRTIDAGAKTTFVATVTMGGGFQAATALTVSGLPAGAAAVFSQPERTASGNSTLTVTTLQNTPAGSYPLTIAATGGGLTRTATVTLVVQAGFAFSVTPAARTINASATTTFLAAISSFGGFASPITISAAGLPPGVSAAFSPATISGSGTATLTVPTVSDTAPGNYPLTFTATGGSLTKTDTGTLSVRSFGVAASASTLSVARGAAGTVTVTQTALNGFAGTARYSVTGLPAGVTAAFVPTSIAASGGTVLTVTVSASAAPGNYPLVIRGTSGTLVKTVALTVTVQ